MCVHMCVFHLLENEKSLRYITEIEIGSNPIHLSSDNPAVSTEHALHSAVVQEQSLKPSQGKWAFVPLPWCHIAVA